MRLTSFRVAAATLLLLGQTVQASAQEVRGTVTADRTGDPLPGALVVLVNEDDQRVARGLARADGEFRIEAPAPGRYRIQAEAVGYASVLTEPVALAPNETVRRELRARTQTIRLRGIGAEPEPCRPHPSAHADTRLLWQEVRKALAAVAVTQTMPGVRFATRRYEREVDAETGWVTAQTVGPTAMHPEHPLPAVTADRMLEHGFVRETADTTVYRAPGVDALLSEAFLSTHCFGVDTGAGGRVGLTFEPVDGRRDLPEIEGTFWLDIGTAALRSLEYRYLPGPTTASGLPGGSIAFRRLANGAWIVWQWRIRTPRLARLGADRTGGVVAIRELGGDVLELRGLGPAQTIDPDAGALEGRIVSEEGVPVADALVYLSGTEYADSTDADGRFRIDAVPEGRYALVWYHSNLVGRAGWVEPTGTIVRPGETTVERIEAVGVDGLLAAGCPEHTRRDGMGVVYGIARDEETAVPLGKSTVRMVPVSGGREASGARARRSPIETVADGTGRFRFCSVPPGEYAVLASLADQRRDSTRVMVGPQARVSLELALRPGLPVAGGEPGRILGRVVDGVDGGPVAAAAVQVGETGPTQLTDERGEFLLTSVPAGRQALRVTHAAFEPVEEEIEIESAALVEIEVTLGPVELEPLAVVATRRGPLVDVYMRMERDIGGTFITAEEIARRNAGRPTDVLRAQGGVRVFSNGSGASGTIEFSRTMRSSCTPAVFLDGVRLVGGGRVGTSAYDAVNSVPASAIEVMEVYPGPAWVPAEFGGRSGACGVIAIWTKRNSGS